MTMHTAVASPPVTPDGAIFTILGGTTIPDRAAIVRAECREGSRVELRLAQPDSDSRVDVWLECRSLLGILKNWKKIGHVPDEAVAPLLQNLKADADVIAYGTVKSIYAPSGRQEAAVTVEISPQMPA
jgi:hypothetical protein